MPSCAVAACKNTRRNIKSREGVIFHSFPKDAQLLEQWKVRCKRQDHVNTKIAVICSDHFATKDYQRNLMNELSGTKHKRRLIPFALPTIGLLPEVKPATVSCALKRKFRHADRESKKFRRTYVDTLPLTEIGSAVDGGDLNVEPSLDENEQLKLHVINLEKQSELHNREIKRLRIQISKLQKSKKKKVMPKKMEAPVESRILKKKLKRIFSPAQTNQLLGVKRPNWTAEDIAKSISVATLSKKAYETIRDVWGIPLPCTSTLRNWGRNFKCKEGILKEVLAIMASEAQNLDNFSRLCILKFDEMSLDSKVTWDKTFDVIQEPASKVQEVMCSGICANWNQPVYYGYDTRMTKELLFEIISAIEKSGYLVAAIVSDFDTSNQALWKSLQVSLEKTHFVNPFDKNRRVWCFADAPHMLKLMRNHLIDQGFRLQDGTVVNKQHLEKLIQINSNELKLSKLTQKLIEVKGAERMRVAPAAKVFSHHTATLCSFAFPDSPQISNFFQTINDWFDIFNSKVPRDADVKIRSAFGMEMHAQEEKLKEVEDLISNARSLLYSKKQNQYVPRTGLLPCQIGVLASIRSLRGLQNDLKDNFNVTYIKTRNLNQDILESHFSEIRAMGRTNDRPTQIDFRHRLKLFLLGAKIRPPVAGNVSVDADTNSNYISRKLLEKAIIEGIFEPVDALDIEEDIEDDLGVPSTTTFNLDDKVTEASLKYLAGYIGYLIKKSGGTDYGDITRRQPQENAPVPTMQNIADLWIHSLSRGGLINPSKSLIEDVTHCEEIFSTHFQCKKLFNVMRISAKISYVIKEAYPEIDTFVVSAFVKTRLGIRVRYLNSNLKANETSRRNKRKAIQFHKSAN